MANDGAAHSLFDSLQTFSIGGARSGLFHALPQLEKAGLGAISRLPVSIRVVLESVLRNCDGKKISEADVRALAAWKPNAERSAEIPFVVARILLQDFTGVPLLVDLAAMRSTVGKLGKNPKIVEPLVPVDLVVDHSVQVDFAGIANALARNMEMEFERNKARYEFLKWGMQAFDTFKVIPPGIGICHQVNLEYLGKGVLERGGVYFPDTLVGTDSHTTMVNGLGIVGWGVGGIEAEAGMLGQPVYFLTPDVVGVNLTGALRPGVTATDLVLRITEMLRQAKVVGKFVEYHGEGAATLSVPDRATIANMSPEYGATMGFFPVDEQTCAYLSATGRSAEQVDLVRAYYRAQGMFGMPRKGDCDYSQVLDLDLGSVVPAVAGPKRPQDRIDLPALKDKFLALLTAPTSANGYGRADATLRQCSVALTPRGDGGPLSGGGAQDPDNGRMARNRDTNPETELEMMNNRPTPDEVQRAEVLRSPAMAQVCDGGVVIAAITSCTNTSNPSVMLAAGLLAKKAVERGLEVKPSVKASLAPGSRVVTDYLAKTGLQPYLDRLGFDLVGYGCTTCIGNSGPLDPGLEDAVIKNDMVVASVLSGNRNFEARVHQSVKANFLMSPPLVVAFALAGRVDVDLSKQPLGKGRDGSDVYLRDIWPSSDEVRDCLYAATDPATYRKLYSDFEAQNPLWEQIPSKVGVVYDWDPASTYIQEPPFFTDFGLTPGRFADVLGARPLAIFGDSVTTDHISPAGAIKPTSPAGRYLQEEGVPVADFNSYGSRRGNDRVMTRGTFANVRIKNLMVPGVEGGVTVHRPDGAQMSIYDAAMKYQEDGVPLIVFAGQEYGTGSSRDWAAKGTRLLGVRVVVAESFERIHRSNLVGMGVLPCQFKDGDTVAGLRLDGTETFDVTGLETPGFKPRQQVTLAIHRANGDVEQVPLIVRIDTPIEIEYYQHGGILPYVLRQLVAAA
jgi:aconitate hydratase